jgi:hypothetical protein
MGASFDGETVAQPSAAADGDDLNQALPDDEDGLPFSFANLRFAVGATPKVMVSVTNTTASAATLYGWIDYNVDGVFDNATERASVAVPGGTLAGSPILVFPVAPEGFIGRTFARFRLSTDPAAANPTGPAADGEVEDYPVTLTRPMIVGPGAGTTPRVRKFDQTASDILSEFLAYNPAFGGGVRVAMGDINNDGIQDIITGAGPGGGPHVRVFNGVTGEQLPGEIGSFYAYHAGFAGGVFVASADVNGDGWDDVITGAGAGGGPHVRALSGKDGALLHNFFAYHALFAGGVTVAAADVNGDGKAEIITGAGPGGGPHVKVLSGADQALLFSFYAYHATFAGGVFVGGGDINGDGRADVISGAGAGGGPHVKVFSGQDAALLQSFFAYHPVFGGGVRVAAADVNGDGRDDVITGAGPGGGPHVRAFSGVDLAELASFYAYDAGFGGGVFVAGTPRLQGAALQVGNESSSPSAITFDDLQENAGFLPGGDGTRSVPATLDAIQAAAVAQGEDAAEPAGAGFLSRNERTIMGERTTIDLWEAAATDWPVDLMHVFRELAGSKLLDAVYGQW